MVILLKFIHGSFSIPWDAGSNYMGRLGWGLRTLDVQSESELGIPPWGKAWDFSAVVERKQWLFLVCEAPTRSYIPYYISKSTHTQNKIYSFLKPFIGKWWHASIDQLNSWDVGSKLNVGCPWWGLCILLRLNLGITPEEETGTLPGGGTRALPEST